MGTSDGSVLGATKIVDHGSDSLRWTMVLVSEGYKASEMAKFHNDAQSLVNTLFSTAPFDTLQSAINVHRLDVASTDSGADDPVACGGTGAVRATFFDAHFCTNGIRRLLVVDNANVMSTVGAHVPPWDMIMVLVNSTVYGGSGGAVAVYSMASGATEIAIHEMGHTAFGLADEYEYYAGCGTGEAGHDHHPAVEPVEPNVTIDSNRATIKWGALVLASTPMPTTSNADCSDCDTQPNPLPADTVGAYEGAHYHHCDAFRPQFNCRMRELNNPFCAVCRRRIVETLTPHLPPKSIFKDLKDIKYEKLEKFEKFEIKEFHYDKHRIKEWKPEKLEIEIGKPVVEIPKTKDAEIPSWQETELRERLSRLEASAAQMAHFITPEQRPDLSRGALRGEPDVAERPSRAPKKAPKAPRKSRRKRRSR
jgi:hypothetical protein